MEKGHVEFFKGEKLNQTLLKFTPLCSLGIHNLIASLKHRLDNLGSFDYIFKLKALPGYDYIQDNCFFGQQVGQKVYLFKMSMNGAAFEFDLVQRMQLGDDLQNAWMMFNHIEHVQGWMNMVCHIYYNLVHCKVMKIAFYDMKSKDMKAQCILWRKLNALAEKKGLGMHVFKGFMANSAQVNWNAIQIVYGIQDPLVKMVNKKRTCFFHWIQFLNKHTKQMIAPKFHDQHKTLYYEYIKTMSLEEANLQYATIPSWWYSSNATSKGAIQKLNNWFKI
jgi:hypothetical protein